MFRGLMTIVTAVAVSWHAVVGCCAHHKHGGHACDIAGERASLAPPANSKVSDGCCRHAHNDLRQTCASGSSEQQLSDYPPGSPCPGEGPTDCQEGTCVFAALGSYGDSPIDQLGCDGSFLGLAVVELATAFCTPRGGEWHDSEAPPLLGGLRLHLAHCVLTL